MHILIFTDVFQCHIKRAQNCAQNKSNICHKKDWGKMKTFLFRQVLCFHTLMYWITKRHEINNQLMLQMRAIVLLLVLLVGRRLLKFIEKWFFSALQWSISKLRKFYGMKTGYWYSECTTGILQTCRDDIWHQSPAPYHRMNNCIISMYFQLSLGCNDPSLGTRARIGLPILLPSSLFNNKTASQVNCNQFYFLT